MVYENNSKEGSILREKHVLKKKKDSEFFMEWVVELHPKERKIVSYRMGKDDYIDDITITLAFTDV